MPGQKSKTWHETERNMPLIAATADGAGTAVLKVNEELSQLNNRLYRNARSYDVSFQMASLPTSDVKYTFYTLVNTWFLNGAIKYAYDTYMRNHQDELDAGIKFSKWHDFSINEQNPEGIWDYLNVALFSGDSWGTMAVDEAMGDASVTGSDGSAEGFHLFGNIANSYNVFREYKNWLLYRKPQSESVGSDQPYAGLLDLADADEMAEKGDQAPYDSDFSSFMPPDTVVDSDMNQHILTVSDTLQYDAAHGQARASTRTFTAPLGLVFILRESGDGTDTDISTSLPELVCRVAPGDYKGVRSRSLTS